MKVEDLSFPDPQHNLDHDDELLRRADKEDGGEALRFWGSSSYFVVLGRTCDAAADVRLDACAGAGVPVLRRSSGGGTVLQGPGCLNFTLVLSREKRPELNSISRSYACILEKVIAALGDCGITAEFRPVCDLVLSADEKKFSGNAQRRGRTHILHHGTILHGFDIALVARYLKMPPRMPDYRRARAHQDFLANIAIDLPSFKTALSRAWS
jgi:lipoate---protein ligase